MSNYTQTTDFSAKDALPKGDPAKKIQGSDFDTEFANISTAVSSKANSANPTFTGTTTIATLSVSGNATITGTLSAATINGGTY